jgi:hypothetical protein
MAAWVAFCAAWEVTRPRPSVFFAAEEEGLFFAAVLFEALLFEAVLFEVLFFAEGPDFVLEAVLRGPLARVLAALLRLAAVVPLEAMVFAAWVLLAAVGVFGLLLEVVPLFGAVLFFAAELRGLLARVLAALLRAEALLPFFARVLAAEALLAALAGLLVGICVSLL